MRDQGQAAKANPSFCSALRSSLELETKAADYRVVDNQNEGLDLWIQTPPRLAICAPMLCLSVVHAHALFAACPQVQYTCGGVSNQPRGAQSWRRVSKR